MILCAGHVWVQRNLSDCNLGVAEEQDGWYNHLQSQSRSLRKFVQLPPFEFVAKNAEWQSCLARLRREKRLAIDLEANSLYAYRERVCLIQISIPGQDYIIDPEQKLDLGGLGQIVSNPKVEKVFHAAEYDLILLKKQYGWTLANLFDTMWASRILGLKQFGLASLLRDRYGARVNKKYQKANWCRRPLPQPQLVYAQMDTHYLLKLRHDLAAELKDASRYEEAIEIFAEQSEVQPGDNSFTPDDFWSISGSNELNGRQRAVLKALGIFRNDEARRQDRPLFKIFEDRTALQLAQIMPQSLDELPSIHGMSRGQVRRYGRRLIKVIESAMHDPVPKRPKTRNRHLPDRIVARYERLHNWRKDKAKRRGVESDVIISRQAMWKLAEKNPKSVQQLASLEILGPWRCETYGKELLKVLAG